MMWAGELFLEVCGGKPESILQWSGDQTNCGHCGMPIRAGDIYMPSNCDENFSNTRDLAAGTGVVCGGCQLLRKKVALDTLQRAVITKNGIFSIAKDTDKAWLFLTPPEPPFIAFHTAAKMEHLVWRTPVTMSKEVILLRRGRDVLTIRPAMMQKAIEFAKEIQDRRTNSSGKTVPISPYLCNSRKIFDEAMHGRLSPWALSSMTEVEKQFFWSLSPGEVWGLTFLLTKTNPQPNQPDQIVVNWNRKRKGAES